MASLDLISFAAVALVVGGLVAVLWEVLARSPRSLLEMATDSRRFAEAPLAGETPPAARRTTGTHTTAANANSPRLAA